ncbi:MAG: amino acid permease [Candidatus Omnitrophica bacterium]|nr:amino acid permease [Candidatus Omnitrophota bacterium]MDE2214995.1 amino acid permease [Candidatus Omnitrophota bacterium]MDE2232113.1 amino acid permease [Candidatus Omnitrophota bacterium]
MNLFVKKPISQLVETAEGGEYQLKRSLGALNLISLGIGAIIGAGLFTLTGNTAAVNAGPAVVVSFVVAAVGCAFAGMCYSELASMIPVAGSAYTYAYATMGEFIAWIIGWDLVLEYAVAASVVAMSWSGYVTSFLNDFGVHIPAQWAACPFDMVTLPDGSHVHGIMNVPAMAIIVVISLLLMLGIRESATVNDVIVVVKLIVVLTFIAVGFHYIKPANYVPFVPPNTGTFGEFGLSGIMRAAGIIFFAYIGFDTVSTAAQEAHHPQRDIPRGIIGSLVICTILYILFSFVLTGMVNYKMMRGDAAPVATAINLTPFPWLHVVVKLGIIGGLTSVILVMLLGQSRIFYAMSRDGLLPKLFSDIHPQWRTPWRSNLLFMVFVGFFAGFFPISKLGNMTSIGTLLAFILVCAGVMVLRNTQPHVPRPYRCPYVPLFPILGILVCLAMMTSLDEETWWRLIIWLAIGLIIYFTYSRFNSLLYKKQARKG